MDIDWVKPRFDWSLDHAWASVKARLIADVQEWQGLVGPQKGAEFLFTVLNDILFEIKLRELAKSRLVVSVLFEGRQLTVKVVESRTSNGVRSLALVPTLNSAAEKRLLCDGEELLIWQVSRRILEPLLFG